MSDSELDHHVQLNKRAFELLRESIRRDYSGKYVGMAGGKIVAAGTDFDSVVAIIEAMNPRPTYYHVFGADEEPIFEVVESVSSEILPE